MNDQYIIPLFVAGSVLLTIFAFFLIAFLLVQKNKHNKYLIEKRQLIFDHQNIVLRTKIEEQENTMDQISKELHDNVKSVLGFAQMNMYRIQDLSTEAEQSNLIARTNDLIGQVVDELHNISHSLNSNLIKQMGIVDSITKEIYNLQLSKNIRCQLEVTGESVELSAEKELHIVRIAQEAMQNCVKHAKASSLFLSINFGEHLLTMKIKDDGIGFDKNKIYNLQGLGFLNMFQRARYVHGTLDVQSAPHHGCEIILTLNINRHGISN